MRPGDIIVAGPNFGCGSSREYAPLALKLLGLGAIIAPTFARIFYRNAINLGIPLFEADLPQLADGQQVILDRERGIIDTDDGRITLPPPPAWVSEVWEAGGIVPFFRTHGRFPGQPAGGQ
jgi:methanogen homoaconitase small subunit